MPLTAAQKSCIRWFEEIGFDDLAFVGGKNASLGDMYRALASQGSKVLNSFMITAEAYWFFLREAALDSFAGIIAPQLPEGETYAG